MDHYQIMSQYSAKGFIAIDLDGTALVQKFDKNKLYGFLHKRSDLRRSLIQYCHIAQNAGYDVVIITARTKLIDQLLLVPGRNKLGTKPTQDIINEFQNHGIHITQVIRAQAKGLKEGLKGECMLHLLEQYKSNGAPDAEGILFDDQLKQIRDVKKIRNQRLIAYDINSYKDRTKFTQKMHQSPVELAETQSEFSLKITALRAKIHFIPTQIYPQEKLVLYKILNDLMTRLKESEECGYQPEVDWVKRAVDGIQLLVNKLASPAPSFKHDFISQLSKLMLGNAILSDVIPNTKCERTIKSLLIYMTRLHYLADIKSKCTDYQLYLNNLITQTDFDSPAIKKARLKIKALDKLINLLENTKNPTKALALFDIAFKANESLIRTFRTGNEFANAIRSFLAKIPIIGYLFQSEGGRLLDTIKQTQSAYSFFQKNHYQKEAQEDLVKQPSLNPLNNNSL